MKRLQLPNQRNAMSGFTLVELMVVVAIIGILAAVAGPRVQQFRARGVQAEAKASLNSIYLAQAAYQDVNDKFFGGAAAAAPGAEGAASTATKVTAQECEEGKDCGTGFPFNPSPGAKYVYSIAGSSGAFAALAGSKQKILNNCFDVWRINASKSLCAVSDAVGKKAVCDEGGKIAADAGSDCEESAVPPLELDEDEDAAK